MSPASWSSLTATPGTLHALHESEEVSQQRAGEADPETQGFLMKHNDKVPARRGSGKPQALKRPPRWIRSRLPQSAAGLTSPARKKTSSWRCGSLSPSAAMLALRITDGANPTLLRSGARPLTPWPPEQSRYLLPELLSIFVGLRLSLTL